MLKFIFKYYRYLFIFIFLYLLLTLFRNLFSGSRIFLSIVSIIISLFLIFFIINKKNISKIDLLSYSFILGGTLGNGIDRVTKGYVIELINLNFIDFPVFNIADISINIGLIIMIYGFIKVEKK